MLERLSANQRKEIEADLNQKEAEAQEAEQTKRADIMAKNQAEDNEIIKENLKKLPKILEEDKNKKELETTE